MSNGDQELRDHETINCGEGEELQESPLDLSLLRIDSFNNGTTTDVSNTHRNHRSSCASCGGTGYISTTSNPMKRPSPEPLTEPKPKKLVLDRNHPLFGFSKVSLPPPPTQSLPILRRCVSDPSSSPGTNTQSPPGNANIVGESPLSKGSASASALPPKAPALRRSASDPYPSPGRTCKEESPSAKRLKRMEDRMREMSKWFHDAMREDENMVCAEEATKDDYELECEEDVSVEREGECVVICFKCPCGKGYKILLLGGDCYYKLI
ncbi:hypothetical protein QUC31_016371 [Theobroma cacao]|uniref:Uncharacterized protein LOC18603346 n=1 Tax=Theobroma cacao TaxID=3641 RepID=A0AB32WAZ2_THECC|nr:PREDICTED: uncharacterized protein LOC18603346 [Theobroma cacao]WRX21028.1 hypothetical protein QQP08_013515 [Theobroma cacao]